MKYLLFLDYDGTLSPIVKKPHQAFLAANRRAFLKKLDKKPNFAVIIISGRILSDLKKRVGIPRIYYIGNHGFEMAGPGIRFLHPAAKAAKPILREIKRKLIKDLREIKGVIIEDKILTLSLHFRLVLPRYLKKVKKIFLKIAGPYVKKKKIRVTRGKKVFEVRPNVKWNKGEAVLWLLQRLTKGQKVFPVYIGDDTTDEDAFRALKNRGISVRVGRKKNTYARHFVKDVSEVYRFLKKLALEF